MRHAETVTFGGSGLDRAAELRRRPEEIAQTPREVVLLWQGKPLVEAPGLDRLARLPADHPVLAQTAPEAILLGRQEDGRLIEARELVGWMPEDVDPDQMNSFVDTSEQRHPLLTDTQVFAELRRVMTRLSPRDAELVATAKAVLHWHVSHRFCARCGAQSEMTQAGWQRACPSCGAQHFPRTDPVVIMLITHGNSVLMGRSPHWPEGMFSLLAGFLEPGETIEAAVRREVWEEAGVKVGAVDYLASQPWAFPTSLMFGCRGVALSREITIDPVEIEQAMWVSREEMMQAFSGAHPVLSPARKGAIAQFLLRNWLADTL